MYQLQFDYLFQVLMVTPEEENVQRTVLCNIIIRYQSII